MLSDRNNSGYIDQYATDPHNYLAVVAGAADRNSIPSSALVITAAGMCVRPYGRETARVIRIARSLVLRV